MSTTITYNGSTIAQVNNETKTLLTSGKWLTGNIVLTDVSDSGGGSVSWELLSDQGITIIADNPNYFIWTFTDPLQENETYRITWGDGGTEYICNTIIDDTSATYDGYFLGNRHVFDTTAADTGEPFLLYRNSSTRMVGITNQSAGSWRIKVERQITTSATLITKTITENGTYSASDDDADGYSSVTVNISSSSAPILQSKTVTPTESTQTITADSNYDGLDSVEVGAISSTYIGSGVARKSSTDLTISGATVTVPSGYYEESVTGTVTFSTITTSSSNPSGGSNGDIWIKTS